MRIRSGLIAFVSIIQSILFLTHLFIYETWIFALARSGASSGSWLRVTAGVLSVSFLAATLLAFRYSNPAVRTLYRIAAVWLGIVSFLFLAAGGSWLVFGLARIVGANLNFHLIVEVLYTAGILSGFTGVLNAGWTRIRRITVRLENLPEAWRGRKAALVSDLHLGHVRNGSFLRRIVAKVMRENPDAVFLAGDLYDGTAIDAAKAAEPLRDLRAPQGTYFVATCAGPPTHRGAGRNLVAGFRAYARRAVFSMDVDGAEDLPPIRLRAQPDRKDADLHQQWRGNVGTAAAAGVK